LKIGVRLPVFPGNALGARLRLIPNVRENYSVSSSRHARYFSSFTGRVYGVEYMVQYLPFNALRVPSVPRRPEVFFYFLAWPSRGPQVNAQGQIN
jgi:hypothetical protein